MAIELFYVWRNFSEVIKETLIYQTLIFIMCFKHNNV